MVTDLSKVINVPRAISSTNSIDYICSCATCIARIQSAAKEKSVMQEAMHHVEEMLQNTPLMSKDISLQFLNTPFEATHTTLHQLNEYILRIAGEDIAFTQVLLSMVKFTHQFNKKYRHPLVCLLHDNNLRIIENIGRMPHTEEYQHILMRINGQLAYLRDQQDILVEMFREKFLAERTLTTLYNRTERAVAIAKTYAQQAMTDFYTRAPQHDVTQNIIVVKPTHKMA